MHHFRGLLAIFCIISSVGHAFSQSPVDVAENTLKVGALSTEEFYYGFAEGDQLIFSFHEVNGKELKEIEILEYKGSSKFMDYKSSKIDNKTLSITSSGIYKFRLYNSAISGRVCKIKIQRIPYSEATKSFNTSVYWKTLYDTTFYTIDEKYLKSRDTVIVPFIEHKVERVHSQTSTNGMPNRSIVKVTLPENTIAWNYYIGVGPNAEKIYQQAEENANKRKNDVGLLSKGVMLMSGGSSILASGLLHGAVQFAVPQNADNIQYWFVGDYLNAQAFMGEKQFYQFDKGNGPLCSKRMTSPNKGYFYMCLFNDNIMDGIDVHIRMSALTVNDNWDTRKVQKYIVTTRKEPYLK